MKNWIVTHKILSIVLACVLVAGITCAIVLPITLNKPDDGGDKQTYTITFDSTGGSAVKPIKAKAGEAISAPEAPIKENFIFDGWYESTDNGKTLADKPFGFSHMPAYSLTLYAKWNAPTVAGKTYKVSEVLLSGTEEEKAEILDEYGMASEEQLVAMYKSTGFSAYFMDDEKVTVTYSISEKPTSYTLYYAIGENGVVSFYETAADKEKGVVYVDDGLFAAEFTVTADCKTFTLTMKFEDSTAAIALICPIYNGGAEHTHTYSDEWSHDETNHWHAATCEHKTLTKDKAAHTFGEWTETKAPTVTEKGEKQRVCSVCEYVEKQEIDAAGIQDNTLEIKKGVTLGKTYDRKAIGFNKDMFAYNGDGEVSFEFKAKDAAVFDADAPFAVGEYIVKVTVAATDEYKEISKEFGFVIDKAIINIGHSEFTTSFKSGKWDTYVFALGLDCGVVKNGDEPEDVSMEIIKDNDWENKSYALYAEDATPATDRVRAKLIGKDAGNYCFEYIDDGNLDATLHCVIKSTMINGKLDESSREWGDFTVDDITFADKSFIAMGAQGELTDMLIEAENNFKQLTFEVFVTGTTVKVAHGTRILWQDDFMDWVFSGCSFIVNEGGPADMKFDLIKNVAGYTDENGYWICEQKELGFTLVVSDDTDVAETGEELFEDGLKQSGYALVKYTHDSADASSIRLELTEGATGTVESHVYGFVDGEFTELTLNGSDYYVEEGKTYYIVIFVLKAGSGNVEIAAYN